MNISHPLSSPFPTCRLPEESELVSVSSEVFDVLLDPVECEGLVPQPHVARQLLSAGGEEAKRPESVVESDHHHPGVHEVLRTVVTEGA